MNQEVAIQRQFWSGIPANVYYLNEGSNEARNAYATPDGYILFGIYMMDYIYKTFGELPIAGVLAHEWGHRAQFVWGFQRGNPYMELEADAFSGYYMALVKQWAWSTIQSYYDNVYALGDYNFHHPNHHGTPAQRLAAARLGVETGLQVISSGQWLSYTELHEIFTAGIGGVIIPDNLSSNKRAHRQDVLVARGIPVNVIRSIANGKLLKTEMQYPRKLSLEESIALGPR